MKSYGVTILTEPLWQNCNHMVVSTFCVHHFTKRNSEILLNVLLLWLHLGVKGFKGNFEVSLLQQFDRNSVQNKSGCQQTKIAYFCYEIFRATYYFVIVENILPRPMMRTKNVDS